MMKRLLAACFAVAVSGGAASAAVVHATSVSDVNLGTLDPSKVGTARYTPSNALGTEDNLFFALGLGGSATFGFGQTFSGTTEIKISETTFGGTGFVSRYGEAIDVFASARGSSAFVGRLTNLQARTGEVLSFTGTFDALTLVDVTSEAFSGSPSPDGFDVESIALTVSDLTPVPLPASGAVLLAGLGTLGLLRRRRRG